MIKGDGDLHVLVLCIRIAVAQKHDFVMMGHVVVGDGDGSGSMDGIDESISAIREGTMVDPDMPPTEYGNPIAVRYSPRAFVAWRVSYHSIPSLLAVMYVDAMDDDVAHVMYGDAWSSCNVDARTSTVDGFEGVHHQLLIQLNHHVPFEDDPQRLVLYHCVSKRSGPWIHRVIVARIRHHVDPTVSSSGCIFSEPDGAVSEPLPVLLPVGVAPPAIVNGVATSTRQVPQFPPRIIDAPKI